MPAVNIADPYNRELIDDAYKQWRTDPDAVDSNWQMFFAGAEFAGNGIGEKVPTLAAPPEMRLQTGVVRLVNWYRQVGHFQAYLDPLHEPPPPHPLLSLESYGLSEADLGRTIDASMYFGMDGPSTLGELLSSLRDTYCRTFAVEYMHIDSLEVRTWLAKRMEPTRNRPHLDLREKYRILMSLHWAAHFENYLHTKYTGAKRFSLEGGETLLPMLDAIVEKSPSLGVQEIVIGMAHRGRLNVLANTLHKPLEQIFNEFEDKYLPGAEDYGDGDVKYHMGFSADVETTDGGKVHLSLSPNPSHLEVVNPVVEGRVRAKQRLFNDTDRSRGLPLLIHGDAAFAGQGVVAETLNMSNLAGYRTGGTVHIVINNQIGFTTSPRDARSTQYCTDIARFIQAPIFHVNGEDPEAAVHAARLALEYRQAFKKDVVIDLVCYRKYGHNEGDEPSFTSPLDYKLIRAKKNVPDTYTERLVTDGSIRREVADAVNAEFHQQLDKALKEVKTHPPRPKKMPAFAGRWSGMSSRFTHVPVETKITEATADRIADALATVPDGFTLHPTIRKLADRRKEDIQGRKSIDWGTAEALAFGSLVLDGHPIRLSGQDSRRGTFSHRHSFYFCHQSGASYSPLANLDPNQAPFDAIDSILSEVAVLGFDYGYSLDDPSTLVMWEAQFGDFANGAQVIIDQFIASGESKWNRASGIVLLLPHGYEGQGPEHSSARFERFLQLCGEDNMQVCNFTTPANIFHALRRQMKRTFRKPLVVMTPKSLLRHPQAVSPMSEFTNGAFREVIDDSAVDPRAVKRVVVCSGKVYYDLLAKQTATKRTDTALVRLEQLYPWPAEQLKAVLDRYPNATVAWAQEEPHNMGGWFFVDSRFRELGRPAGYVGRDPSASPATGSHYVHEHEQKELVRAAFDEKLPYFVTAAKASAAH